MAVNDKPIWLFDGARGRIEACVGVCVGGCGGVGVWGCGWVGVGVGVGGWVKGGWLCASHDNMRVGVAADGNI